MKHIVSIILLLTFLQSMYSQKPGVSDVLFEFPESLKTDTLLVPAYETFATRGLTGKTLKQTQKVNALSKEHNDTQEKLLRKFYPFPWKLVPLAEVASYRDKGHYFYLDYVPMPRHWRRPNTEAMVAMYKRYDRTIEIYRITNYQFWYYFYIRDLTTDVAYMTNPPHGNADVYAGMTWLWKKIAKALE